MANIDKELIKKAKPDPLSVLQAKRKHAGTWTIIGKIVTVSEMYVMEVQPEPPETEIIIKDAKSIELEDIDKLDENERLDVTLYNDDIMNVIPGEIVEITGNIQLEGIVKKSNVKKVRVEAISIRYVNRKELVISDKDKEAFKKFAFDCKVHGCSWNLMNRLTAMFAPNVVGHVEAKIGILRSIVGGHDIGQRGGGRVNTFLVGDPGTAKSTLGQEAARIKLNSRHVSALHASAKTITAIAEKENETISLRLGSIPLARNAVCAIDEITEFPLEEQGRLLDVLEEGQFPLDKYGGHWIVPAPTTIIATANPIQSYWSNSEIVSKDDINIRKTLLDRFQQTFIFRKQMNKEQIHDLVVRTSTIRKRKPHNYNFLRKYLVYASGIEVKKITTAAEQMLNEFFEDAKLNGSLENRMLGGLFSMAEAQAKLHLKDTIDEEIATQTMESVQLMMIQYGEMLKTISNPKIVTYNKFLEILQNNQVGVSIKELCKIACYENQQISAYLGTNWSVEHNIRIRVVVDMLRNHDKVKEVKSRPIVLQWVVSDTTDTTDNDSNTKTKENDSKDMKLQSKVGSDISDISDRNKGEDFYEKYKREYSL